MGQHITDKKNLIELLVWLHCNRVMADDTQAYWKQLNRYSKILSALKRQIAEIVPLPIRAAKHEVFEQGCRTQKLVFFINQSPLNELTAIADNYAEPNLSQACSIDYLTIKKETEVFFA